MTYYVRPTSNTDSKYTSHIHTGKLMTCNGMNKREAKIAVAQSALFYAKLINKSVR